MVGPQLGREVPQHDVLLTNPPYSGDHVERLLRFCRSSGAECGAFGWLVGLVGWLVVRTNLRTPMAGDMPSKPSDSTC